LGSLFFKFWNLVLRENGVWFRLRYALGGASELCWSLGSLN
jgi:hypothetical protein